jgi:hypothetical protein
MKETPRVYLNNRQEPVRWIPFREKNDEDCVLQAREGKPQDSQFNREKKEAKALILRAGYATNKHVKRRRMKRRKSEEAGK